MTAFWIVAALLSAGGLAFVLPPLLRQRAAAQRESRESVNTKLYREELAALKRELEEKRIDERQYREAELEIERRLLEDIRADAPQGGTALPARAPRGTALALAALLPVAAVLLYLQVGNPAALDPRARAGAADTAHSITPAQIEGLVAKLAERLERAPDDAEGWVMLGRSYNVLGRFDKSAQAYARAAKLIGDNPSLLADYADSLAMAQGRKLQGEPYEIVKRALKADPNHIKALALAGSAEFEQGRYSAAAEYWERSLTRVPPDSDFARSIQASIDEARQLGGTRAAAGAARPGKAEAVAARDSISGTVKIAPTLARQVAPGDTLFVFARAADGGKMPIAIVRSTAAQLPFAFRLDDSSAMMPNAKLSNQSRVLVGARISKSGNAIAQPGDLQGLSAPVAPGASGLELTINEVVK